MEGDAFCAQPSVRALNEYCSHIEAQTAPRLSRSTLDTTALLEPAALPLPLPLTLPLTLTLTLTLTKLSLRRCARQPNRSARRRAG
jgi:hypothetical protein